MAMEIAKKLVEELLADETRKAEFQKDPEAFLAVGGFDCTLDEMKEYYTLNREVDDAELNVLSGGGNAACSSDFYNRSCAATVEFNSWCGSNDKCYFWDVQYSCTRTQREPTPTT